MKNISILHISTALDSLDQHRSSVVPSKVHKKTSTIFWDVMLCRWWLFVAEMVSSWQTLVIQASTCCSTSGKACWSLSAAWSQAVTWASSLASWAANSILVSCWWAANSLLFCWCAKLFWKVCCCTALLYQVLHNAYSKLYTEVYCAFKLYRHSLLSARSQTFLRLLSPDTLSSFTDSAEHHTVPLNYCWHKLFTLLITMQL